MPWSLHALLVFNSKAVGRMKFLPPAYLAALCVALGIVGAYLIACAAIYAGTRPTTLKTPQRRRYDPERQDTDDRARRAGL